MDYIADVGVSILIYVILGLSLNMLVGYAGQISLAHAVFYGIGGYAVGLLTLPSEATGTAVARGVTTGYGWPFIPALAVGTMITLVAALVVAFPALRVTGEYVILLTLAFQVVANQLMNTLSSVTGGPYGLTPIPGPEIFGISVRSSLGSFIFFLVVALSVAMLTWWVGVSPFGRVLRGIREDEVAVAATGKSTTVAKVLVFSFSAGIAGLVGGMAAAYYRFIAPGNYSLDVSIFLVAIVVLGGSGNVMGVTIGAVVLGGLRPFLQNVAGDTGIVWQSVIYGLGLAIIMFIRPGGVFPEGVGLDRILQRRIYLPLVSRLGGTNRSDDKQAAQEGPLHRESDEPEESLSTQPVLRAVGLSKSFAGLCAVDDVDIELPRGKITGLVGPNGAGKTTVFNLLTGTIHPDAGKVLLKGHDVTGLPIHQLATRGLVRSFQDVRIFQELSVLDNVAMAVPEQDGENPAYLVARPLHIIRQEAVVRRKAHEAIRFVGLEDLAEERVDNLSFGDQKLVAIARVIATEADVLLLDEPTSGVDPSRVDEIIALIKRLSSAGRTICIVEHSVHLIEQLADRVIFLEEGRVAAEGPMSELRAQKRLVEIYFGT